MSPLTRVDALVAAVILANPPTPTTHVGRHRSTAHSMGTRAATDRARGGRNA